MPPNTPLTGRPVASALWAAGLAPEGVIYYADTDCWWHGPDGAAWQPWCDISSVWHLVLRYRLHLVLWPDHPRVVCGLVRETTARGWTEEAATDADLPAAVGRLALRIQAADLAQEAQRQPSAHPMAKARGL